MTTETQPVRRRAERIDVGLARRALAVVRPVHGRLSDLNERAARLRGRQLRYRGTELGNVSLEAADLLIELDELRCVLSERSSALPPEVTAVSHYQDALKAISALSRTLQSLRVN